MSASVLYPAVREPAGATAPPMRRPQLGMCRKPPLASIPPSQAETPCSPSSVSLSPLFFIPFVEHLFFVAWSGHFTLRGPRVNPPTELKSAPRPTRRNPSRTGLFSLMLLRTYQTKGVLASGKQGISRRGLRAHHLQDIVHFHNKAECDELQDNPPQTA